jgi:membrane protein implicated in regulation of membrane protease activity
MLLAARYFWLIIFVAGEHFADGLAYPAVLIALALGWKGIRPDWLAMPILLSAYAANYFFAYSTSEGKLSGAKGNFAFELMVFTFLSAVAYLVGWALRRRRKPSGV